MNGKLLSASIVFALMIGSASPLHAQAVSGTVNGATGGFAQGSLPGAAHGQLGGAAGGFAEAGLPDRPAHGNQVRRGADKARDTAGQAKDGATERAERTSDSASSRTDSAQARASLLADGSVSKAVGVAGSAPRRADDARPELDRPERPVQPADAEVGVNAAPQGNANVDRSGARADARGAPSVSTSASTPRGTEASAEAYGSAAVKAEADSSR